MDPPNALRIMYSGVYDLCPPSIGFGSASLGEISHALPRFRKIARASRDLCQSLASDKRDILYAWQEGNWSPLPVSTIGHGGTLHPQIDKMKLTACRPHTVAWNPSGTGQETLRVFLTSLSPRNGAARSCLVLWGINGMGSGPRPAEGARMFLQIDARRDAH